MSSKDVEEHAIWAAFMILRCGAALARSRFDIDLSNYKVMVVPNPYFAARRCRCPATTRS